MALPASLDDIQPIQLITHTGAALFRVCQGQSNVALPYLKGKCTVLRFCGYPMATATTETRDFGFSSSSSEPLRAIHAPVHNMTGLCHGERQLMRRSEALQVSNPSYSGFVLPSTSHSLESIICRPSLDANYGRIKRRVVTLTMSTMDSCGPG